MCSHIESAVTLFVHVVLILRAEIVRLKGLLQQCELKLQARNDVSLRNEAIQALLSRGDVGTNLADGTLRSQWYSESSSDSRDAMSSNRRASSETSALSQALSARRSSRTQGER